MANQNLKDIVNRLDHRLWKLGFDLENVLTDMGYSCGENYANLDYKAMTSKRQSTVEPVIRTLNQFMGLRKKHTIGIQQ